MTRLRVLHVTSEVAPYSQTGGLGGVLGELPAHQRHIGLDARVVTPLYGCVDRADLTPIGPLPKVRMGGHGYEGQLWRNADDTVRFIDVPGLLDRPHPYGDDRGPYPDNPIRFGVFCRMATALRDEADIYHLHDWQAGLTALYLGGQPATMLTVHNLGFQGLCGFEWADRLGIPTALQSLDGVEYYGQISLLKAGLVLADMLTTVSPNYAKEIQSEPQGLGFASLFRRRRLGLTGVLNGIDPHRWNPATDTTLPVSFDVDDRVGKSACRAALRKTLGLDEGPLFGFVSRAVAHKGMDVLGQAAEYAIERGARFAVLAHGEPAPMAILADLAERYPSAFAFVCRFDPVLARRLFAGVDFMVAPSHYEPCGIGHLIGMRYGAVPVVRLTGGLVDTVEDGVTGLGYERQRPEILADTLQRAADLYANADAYRAMQTRCMQSDWAWTKPAHAYADLYRRLG